MKHSISTWSLALLLLPASLAAAGGPSASPQANAEPEASRLAVEPSYHLGPADVVAVFVWKEPDLSTQATVRPDGRISLPLAGELVAAGKTAEELEGEITSRLEKYLDQPVVTVSVSQVNSPKISVLGEVRRPGRFLIPQRTTVLDAIALSGGFTAYAHRGRVVVLRRTSSGVERIPVDVKRQLQGGQAFFLEPGDTVHVD